MPQISRITPFHLRVIAAITAPVRRPGGPARGLGRPRERQALRNSSCTVRLSARASRVRAWARRWRLRAPTLAAVGRVDSVRRRSDRATVRLGQQDPSRAPRVRRLACRSRPAHREPTARTPGPGRVRAPTRLPAGSHRECTAQRGRTRRLRRPRARGTGPPVRRARPVPGTRSPATGRERSPPRRRRNACLGASGTMDRTSTVRRLLRVVCFILITLIVIFVTIVSFSFSFFVDARLSICWRD